MYINIQMHIRDLMQLFGPTTRVRIHQKNGDIDSYDSVYDGMYDMMSYDKYHLRGLVVETCLIEGNTLIILAKKGE